MINGAQYNFGKDNQIKIQQQQQQKKNQDAHTICHESFYAYNSFHFILLFKYIALANVFSSFSVSFFRFYRQFVIFSLVIFFFFVG